MYNNNLDVRRSGQVVFPKSNMFVVDPKGNVFFAKGDWVDVEPSSAKPEKRKVVRKVK